MITIITTKRWKRMQEDNQQMHQTLTQYDDAIRKLIRRIDRIEKAVTDITRENRIMRAELRKIEKQNKRK